MIRVLLILFLASSVKASNLDSLYLKAYLTENMKVWPELIEKNKHLYKYEPSSVNLEKLIVALHGYAGYLGSTDDKEKGKEYVNLYNSYVDQLLQYPGNKAKYYAFKSAYHAFLINLSPTSAMRNGPKIFENIEKAYEADKNDIQTIIEKGNIAYHTPRLFGGSYKDAAEYFQKAIDKMSIFEKYANSWLLVHAYLWLAKSYEEQDEFDNALNTYKKMLSLYPESVAATRGLEKHGQ
jgi:tetratricopeptide (TPR) repeat protein